MEVLNLNHSPENTRFWGELILLTRAQAMQEAR